MPQTKHSPLLKLPPELHDHIYHEALVNPGPIMIADYDGTRAPSLLQTCQQIRSEASKIYYATNAFRIRSRTSCTKALVAWVRTIGDPERGMMSRVELPPGPFYSAWQATRGEVASYEASLGKAGLSVGKGVLYVKHRILLPDRGEWIWTSRPEEDRKLVLLAERVAREAGPEQGSGSDIGLGGQTSLDDKLQVKRLMERVKQGRDGNRHSSFTTWRQIGNAYHSGMAKSPEPPLLKLPAELRNRIYEMVLLDATTTHVTTAKAKPDWHSPGLLRTCHQIRSEASSIYYAVNTFRVSSLNCSDDEEDDLLVLKRECLDVLKQWLGILAATDKQALRRTYLDDHYYHSVRAGRLGLKAYYKALSAAGLRVGSASLFVEVVYGPDGSKWMASGDHLEAGDKRDNNGHAVE